MDTNVAISVVIPTCNRRESLLRLLNTLEHSSYPLLEVLIVDSSDITMTARELESFTFNSRCIPSARSVCIQRNKGIQEAKGNWVFLCDDDLEIPANYLATLISHIEEHPEAGCVTGKVLQNNGKNNAWTHEYPVTSIVDLLARFVFQLSLWGEIKIKRESLLTNLITRYYQRRGNHLSKAGWPVVVDLSGRYFRTPFYGLGASLVKKEWLLKSPYDELLDPHGIGDNFGVAAGFPHEGIHVVNEAFVYHFRAPENRLLRSQLYYRRIMALDYFLRTKDELSHISRIWFLWSVLGNSIILLSVRNPMLTIANLKLWFRLLTGNNPYVRKKATNGREAFLKEDKPDVP